MIKTIKIPSIRVLKITLFFIFFTWIFISLYAFLSEGIKIERFFIIGAKIEGFYLRLDKKLILNIETLDLSHLKQDTHSDFSPKIQTQIAKNIHFILQYFQQISLKNIYFKDYKANISYDGENFILNLPTIYTKLNLKEESSKVLLKVHHLFVKSLGIYYEGLGFYDLRRQKIQLDGKLSILNKRDYSAFTRLNLYISGDFNNLILQGNSEAFSNIQFLRPLLPKIQNPFVDAWIFDNYSVEYARIKNFYVQVPLNGKNILQHTLKTLYIQAEAKNADVIFHPHLAPAHADVVELVFKDNTLNFYPKNPTYKHHKANGTSVALMNLIGQNPSLAINLHTNTTLDADILEILKAYGITLPISAPQANIYTNLYIKTDLITYNTQSKGIFNTKDSEVLINNIPLYSKDLSVELNNHHIKIISKNTHYKNFIQADSNVLVDTQTHTISGDILVHSLKLLDSNILNLTNHTLPFNVNFKDSNNISLTLPTLNFNANFGEIHTFNLINLESIKPFSKILQDHSIINGTMHLHTQDFNAFTAKIQLQTAQQLLFNKDNSPITSMELNLNYALDKLFLESTDKRFQFTQDRDTQSITLQDFNLHINNNSPSNNSINVSNKPLTIKGKNTDISFKDYKILSNSFSFNLFDDSIKGTLEHKNGKAYFYKYKDSITLDMQEFGDTFINTITQKHTFNGGRFFLNLNTHKNGVLIGKATLLNTSIDELNILQNLVAFIDTIPSLLTLKAPAFNQNGYYVNKGEIHFGINKEFLAIDMLNFDGSSMDIQGKGIVYLGDKNIDFHAKLIFAKSLSNILNKIPLVNYILLGRDGTFSTNFKIKGTLNTPDIQTQTTQDILLSPFNILKRTITSPLEIFN